MVSLTNFRELREPRLIHSLSTDKVYLRLDSVLPLCYTEVMDKKLINKKIFRGEISDYNGPLSPSEVRATHNIAYYDGHAECENCLSKTHGRSIAHPCFDSLENPEEMGLSYHNYPQRQDRIILTYSDGSQEILLSPLGHTFNEWYIDSFEVEEIKPTSRELVMGRGPNRDNFADAEFEFAVVEQVMELRS